VQHSSHCTATTTLARTTTKALMPASGGCKKMGTINNQVQANKWVRVGSSIMGGAWTSREGLQTGQPLGQVILVVSV
jgi:hypothetical protein